MSGCKQPGGLAERLYGLRKDAGLTGERMAATLGWPPTKVSKIENGNQIPTADDIRAWAEASGHPEAADGPAGPARRRADRPPQVEAAAPRGGLAAVQEDHDRLAREAKRIRSAETLIVPGLLQTAEYARGIFARLAACL